jgi:PTH1 family peptidyl-tRNA hydrolase
MWLVVGLGNPGVKYEKNRHNIGFMAVDAMLSHHGFSPEREKFSGLATEGALDLPDSGRAKALFLKPQTFMNDSGRSVGAACQFYKIPPERVIVFYDELDLAPGKFRLKKGGGAAGHNGIKSVTSAIGPDYWRARMGIGHPGHRDRVLPFVLGDFSKSERESWVHDLTDACARSIDLIIAGQTDAFQTRVTHLAPAPVQGAGKATEKK